MKELGIENDSGRVCFGQIYGMCDHVSFSLGKPGTNRFVILMTGECILIAVREMCSVLCCNPSL